MTEMGIKERVPSEIYGWFAISKQASSPGTVGHSDGEGSSCHIPA